MAQQIDHPFITKIITFIQDQSTNTFESLALEIFQFQYKNNQAYQQYCKAMNCKPEAIQDWKSIPPLPASAFKQTDITCFSAEHYFLTSGTTRGEHNRGKHWLPFPELYQLVLRTAFKEFVLPDCDSIHTIMLAQDYRDFPHSSLSYMLQDINSAFGKVNPVWLWGAKDTRLEAIIHALQTCSKQHEPVLIMGVVSAFLLVIEYCKHHSFVFDLPSGSRLMDTGGLKNTHPGFNEAELPTLYAELFNIPITHQIREFGMTELLSQYYTPSFKSYYYKMQSTFHTEESEDALSCDKNPKEYEYHAPHWIRTLVLDPLTLAPCNPGETGLVCHVDLANAGTAISILTEDVGVATENGFIFKERLLGSEARGCSLVLEQYLPAK